MNYVRPITHKHTLTSHDRCIQVDIDEQPTATRVGCPYLRQWVAERDGEGLALAVAPDVALQAVLAAERLLTAVAGAVERLLPFRDHSDRDSYITSLAIAHTMRKRFSQTRCCGHACTCVCPYVRF